MLVPILDQSSPEVILTIRSHSLAHHPGQVSFPGGAAMSSDVSGVNTALREAEEEIGLSPDDVEPVGFLDRVDTISDYRVLPVVALARPRGPFVLDPVEVADVFTMPLNRALDLDAWEYMTVDRDGVSRRVWRMEWEGRTIWGVTAHILRNLARRIQRRQS